MHNKTKGRRFFSLQFFERKNYVHNHWRSRTGLGPIGKKTVPKVFVNYAVLTFNDLLATKNPRAKKDVQVFAPHLLAERGKAADVGDKKPARNTLNFPQRPLHYFCLFVFFKGHLLTRCVKDVARFD